MPLSDAAIMEVKRLRTRDYRRKTGLTIVEGYPEFSRAVKAGIDVQALYLCPEIFTPTNGEFSHLPVTEVSKNDFAQIAFGERLKGVLAVCRPHHYELSELRLSANPFLMIIEGVEKPGNLGTIIRSADGAGVDAVIVCDGRTDVYNHNVVRSSIGTVFHVPTAASGKNKIKDYLTSRGIKIITASAKAKKSYTECNFNSSIAVVIGNEHSGVTAFWQEFADESISIPMQRESSSLNAAMSASILMYEAHRQRSQDAKKAAYF